MCGTHNDTTVLELHWKCSNDQHKKEVTRPSHQPPVELMSHTRTVRLKPLLVRGVIITKLLCKKMKPTGGHIMTSESAVSFVIREEKYNKEAYVYLITRKM
ncbi:uncharacterized protein LOC118513571 [Anopheles stephensi]|uniref:uncharacterized protein LOC118513571 n=1 Tax=Anopheles stephensi TaxID=30069 RepID=UPI001658BE75|nr:uncharacterized protein LOC118513571 [Anopheles stephensi]